MSRESRQIAAPLAHRVSKGASSLEVGAAVAVICRNIDAELSPILGKQGVSALFKRSLHLAGQSFACLRSAHSNVHVIVDAPALENLLTTQAPDDALAAASAFLSSFHELLTSLIGPMLTERLLRSVWSPPSSPSAQDPTS